MPLGIRHYGTVSLGELHLARLGRIVGYPFEPRSRHSLDLAGEDVFAFLCPADLVDVDRVHAREPVEARHVERRDPRYTGGSRHPLGQTCGNRQAVRAAPGAAAHGEPLDTEAVCDRGNVSDAVHHPPAAEAIGAAVAGPVVGDHARSDICIRARVACPTKREPGVPWRKKTGNPSGSPHSAIVSVRPSAAATVCVPDAPAMTASSCTRRVRGKLVLVRGHSRTLAQARLAANALSAGRRRRWSATHAGGRGTPRGRLPEHRNSRPLSPRVRQPPVHNPGLAEAAMPNNVGRVTRIARC